MADVEYDTILGRAKQAKAYYSAWAERIGDLKSTDETYEEAVQQLRDKIEHEREGITVGRDIDEIRSAVDRMLKYNTQLKELEMTRESTADGRRKTHKSLLVKELRALLKDLADIVRGLASTTDVPEIPDQGPSGTAESGGAGGTSEPRRESRGAPDTETLDGPSHPSQQTADAPPEGSASSSPPDRVPSSESQANADDPPSTETTQPSNRRSATRRAASDARDKARKGTFLHTTPTRPVKRRRVETNYQENGDEEQDPPEEGSGQHPLKKRPPIEFKDVYQDGKAEFRHFIIEYPPNSSKFYIFYCEEHGVHFTTNALVGAAKHLNGEQHNNQRRSHENAIKTLGYEVLNCTTALAEMNNAALTESIQNGTYTVFNRNKLRRAEKEAYAASGANVMPTPQGSLRARNNATKTSSVPSPTPGSPEPPPKTRKRKSFDGVSEPLVGEVYFGCWSKNRWFVVLLLPRGEAFGDPTFEDLNLPGGLINTGLLGGKIPRCYKYSPGATELLGWSEGFGDGGRSVLERQFPIIFFDNKEFPNKCSVGWMSTKQLRPFDLDDDLASNTPQLDTVQEYLSTRKPLNILKRQGGRREPDEDGGENPSEDEEDEVGEEERMDTDTGVQKGDEKGGQDGPHVEGDGSAGTRSGGQGEAKEQERHVVQEEGPSEHLEDFFGGSRDEGSPLNIPLPSASSRAIIQYSIDDDEEEEEEGEDFGDGDFTFTTQNLSSPLQSPRGPAKNQLQDPETIAGPSGNAQDTSNTSDYEEKPIPSTVPGGNTFSGNSSYTVPPSAVETLRREQAKIMREGGGVQSPAPEIASGLSETAFRALHMDNTPGASGSAQAQTRVPDARTTQQPVPQRVSPPTANVDQTQNRARAPGSGKSPRVETPPLTHMHVPPTQPPPRTQETYSASNPAASVCSCCGPTQQYQSPQAQFKSPPLLSPNLNTTNFQSPVKMQATTGSRVGQPSPQVPPQRPAEHVSEQQQRFANPATGERPSDRTASSPNVGPHPSFQFQPVQQPLGSNGPWSGPRAGPLAGAGPTGNATLPNLNPTSHSGGEWPHYMPHSNAYNYGGPHGSWK